MTATEEEEKLLLPRLEPDGGGSGRRICGGRCGRPARVCLCEEMPSDPIPTRTEIVILHHPHEQRHKLATVPVLAKCLGNCRVVIGRRLRLGDSPILDSLYYEAVEDPTREPRAIFLFPGNESMPSSEINHWSSKVTEGNMNGIVMIVFDGTWKHAKEMVSASLPFLSKFATCVCLGHDVEVAGGSIFDSDVILRKEPFKGCMSTLEAVARALRVLEPDGAEIEEQLVNILKTMVSLQACHLKPMVPRVKLPKKKTEERGKINSTANEREEPSVMTRKP